jgi:hypothetical protein
MAYLNWWGVAVCTGWMEWNVPTAPAMAMICDMISTWDAPWPLHRSDFSQAEMIAQAIQRNDAWACADGSYMVELSMSLAMAAWRIVPKSLRVVACRGETPVSGVLTEVNPYRTELQGIHTLLMAIKAICTYYEVYEGSIDVFCDCDNIILQANRRWKQLALGTKNADLIRVIRWIRADLPIKVNFHEIAGHQDKHTLYRLLSTPGQMNVDCDQAAKSFFTRISLRG